MSVFRAMGAPERFLGLLKVIYRSVSLRYIINGYLTEAVRMLCGLEQGDPVSCPIWNVCFQPYLDALVRRKIALDLSAVFLPTRAAILTHLAFADDAIVLVSSPAALDLLTGLAVDWRLATYGRSNTAKTTALPLGLGWTQDERASGIATVRTELLRSTEVLVLQPTLPSLHPRSLSDDARRRLKKFGAIIDLCRRPQTTGDPVNPGLLTESLLEKLWADVSASSPIASALPQPAAVRTAIGDCHLLRPCTYTFLGATRPFTIKALRHFINEACYPSLDDGSRLEWPTDLTKSQKQHFWIWLNIQWATAVEKDVHWKLIFVATPTCVLQHHHGHAASDGCPQCGQRDTFMHFYFECDHPREFWRLTLQLLRVALGQAGDFQPGEVDSPQIMLGLPRRESRAHIVVRVVLAIAFNKLYLARWHQHKDQIPLPTPYLLTREVRSHLKFRLRRLPDGELLDHMM